MIIVTGAAGFIGSCLVSKLNDLGHTNLVLVDDFSNAEKNKNLARKQFSVQIERNVFVYWLKENASSVSAVYHIGARTDTTEFDVAIFDELNLNYSKDLWKICAEYKISFVYASSAATYGMGEFGFIDSHEVVEKLVPLNPYGDSKNDFDKWALKQETQPSFWAGLKFFNVYGPNEFHKNRMASVIFNAVKQINETGSMRLFRSHNTEYKDGEQLRDFVYVKDVVEVLTFMMREKNENGLYNLGSGKARSFKALVNATFKALGKESAISYIDTPEDIRDKYQYFTEANMKKLILTGYSKSFTDLESGVKDYVQNYLIDKSYY
ncbi:MAG: ADP-glyceromanno-heptose 6-epimerase [Flavobacteriales bacterium]|jgi:ADP-L-glycero-D-manno-heptose 6-epimerase|nr:ADP-glyceromanno-heptose 6-epimerase [Flavobacteriales bacterium]MBT5750685.1 ADP-glyceromanno-heptose 6-epimerase [Flavobacteriales bacterium]